MGFFNKYPYTDFHELNLDWLISKMRELQIDFEEFKVLNSITFSGAWDITKQYPAWTIVSDNNIGYISVKPVPVGVTLTNTDYWKVVIDYTAQIADITSRIVVLENKTEYVTPEEFGAAGDGVTNDTQAIKDAIDTGKTVLMFNNYMVSSTLTVDTSKNIFCFGKIIYTGINACIDVWRSNSNLYIKENEGDGTNTGIAVRYDNGIDTSRITAHNDVNIGYIHDVNIGILLSVNNACGLQYNNIKFDIITNAVYGIKCDIDSGWINSNYFMGGRIGPVDNAIVQTRTAGEFDGNYFENVGIEGVTSEGIVLDTATKNKFTNMRFTESFSGTYMFDLSESSNNLFEGDITVAVTQIKDSTTANPGLARLYKNRFECKLITNTPNGSWIDKGMYSFNDTFLMDSYMSTTYRVDQADVDFTASGTIIPRKINAILGGSHILTLPYLFDTDCEAYTYQVGSCTINDCTGATVAIDLYTGGNRRIFKRIGSNYVSTIVDSYV